MGEAKRRGTYEERKAKAEKKLTQRAPIKRVLPAPNHVALMGIVAALTQTPNAAHEPTADNKQGD